MKKALIISFAIFLSGACKSQVAVRDDYPYLPELIEGYYSSNFSYPLNVDDVLTYWDYDKARFIERYGMESLSTVQQSTFDKF